MGKTEEAAQAGMAPTTDAGARRLSPAERAAAGEGCPPPGPA